MIRLLFSLAAAAVLAACSGQIVDNAAIPEGAGVEDLYIVDCLLPGQVRQLGKTTYLTPRRPTRTTAADCRIRGGEYVAYDRADYKTALKVWLPAAEGGDADAQNTVGEIFEQGLGTEPNYEVAAHWFTQAANQGHKGAAFNLGTLYETGKGVPQSKTTALNWYRKAWGLTDDSLVYRSNAEKQMLADAQENVKSRELSVAEQEAKLRERERELTEREKEQMASHMREVTAMAAAEPTAAGASKMNEMSSDGKAREMRSKGKNFGRYFALVIGNGEYQHMDNLVTPVTDVQRIGNVLRNRYGFQVQTLTNGDDASVLTAVNNLDDTLNEDDNLLIYYAGYGNRRPSGAYESGYWLPVNAEPPPNDTYWVPTEQVSGHLGRLKARRIMVVADSSFAGLLADNPGFLLVNSREKLVSDAYIDLRFPNRSRLLMASGQDMPMVNPNSKGSSVFTSAFIAALEDNKGVLTAPALFLNMLDYLDASSMAMDPEFKAIKRAGDEVGDFFFVAM